jgi:hypothetical protein
MRLTLRTMLAYLDGILEPEDAQDIGKKIEESTFASELIHRIRDLMRRQNVAPPDSTSAGPSLGPNAMAEYLDNMLPPEKVAEFEKICLDSDLHLAEVAACHQILTLVLGEPAEIEPASRQRMYDIHAQARLDEIPISADSQTEIVLPPPLPDFSTSGKNTQTDRKVRPKPAIPDYLREPINKYRWVSVSIAGVAAVFLLLLLFKALGLFEPGTTMGNMLVGIGLVKNKQVAIETLKPAPQPVKPAADASAGPELKKPSAESVGKATPSAPSEAEAAKPSGTEQQSAAPSPGNSEKASAPEKIANQSEPASETGTSPKADVVPNPDVTPKESAETAKPSGNELAENAAPNLPKPPEDKTPPVSERLGRYTSEDQILLVKSGADADWQRVASKDFLSADQQILALPTYRPEINLSAGVKLRMLGGTELELLPPANAREPAGIKILMGRIVTTPSANAGTRLRIMIGSRVGVITFVDPDSVVAADVRNIHTPGIDPETETARITADFIITAGRALWDETGQKTLEIAAPAQFKLVNQAPPEVMSAKNLPKWDTEPISKLDSSASATISQTLQDLPPARAQLGLMELAEHRRKEVRWLAIRCLGYLDYFDPMVSILKDATAKQQDWSDNIDQLREAVARDHETASAVRKTLESRYPQEAPEMYRMLLGYSDKNLESGEDENLVKSLDNDNLAIRVLSFWNLKDITGKSLGYPPEQTPARRQPSIQAWKQRLKAGEIRNKATDEKAGNAARENVAPLPGSDLGQ